MRSPKEQDNWLLEATIFASIWKTSKLTDLLEDNAEEDYFDYRYGGTGATRGNF